MTHLIGFFRTIWKGRILILIVACVSLAATIGISFLVKPMYRARLTLLPVVSGSSYSNPYSGLASLIDISIPRSGDKSGGIFAILQSRTLREKLVSELGLEATLTGDPEPSVRRFYRAVGELSDRMTVAEEPRTGLIEITVELSDPALAKEVANAAFGILEQTLMDEAFTASEKHTEAVRTQMIAQEIVVAELQAKLTAYQRENMIILPENQINTTLQMYNDLKRRRLDAELELSGLEKSAPPQNLQIVSLRQRLEAIDERLSVMEQQSTTGGGVSLPDAPDILVEYNDLVRALESARRLYDSLLLTYQRLRFEESQDVVYVQVIDPAIEPLRQSRPQRRRAVAFSAVLSVCFGLALVLFLDLLARERRAIADGAG